MSKPVSKKLLGVVLLLILGCIVITIRFSPVTEQESPLASARAPSLPRAEKVSIPEASARSEASLPKKLTSVPSEFSPARNPALMTDGSLSPSIVRDLEINAEEEQALSRTFEAARSSIAAAALPKLQTISTSPEQGIAQYRILSFEAEGEAIFEKYSRNVAEILGESRGASFLERFHRYSYFGNFGKNDMVVTFREKTIDTVAPPSSPQLQILENKYMGVQVEQYDARSGKKLGGFAGRQEDTAVRIPDVFTKEK